MGRLKQEFVTISRLGPSAGRKPSGARRVIVLTEHVAKDGTPKIVQDCSLPLTGRRVVNRIITNKAVFDVDDHGLMLRNVVPGVSLDPLRATTGADFRVDPIIAANDKYRTELTTRALTSTTEHLGS